VTAEKKESQGKISVALNQCGEEAKFVSLHAARNA
jgi:hypothetical protein